VSSGTLSLYTTTDIYRTALNAGRSSEEKAVSPSLCQTRGL